MRSNSFLITGIGGFVGRHLLTTLQARFPSARITGAGLRQGSASCPVEIVDFRDARLIEDLVRRRQPDCIFHLVAAPTQIGWQQQFQVNVAPSLHIMEAVLRHSPGTRVVLIGSAAEYGVAANLPVDETAALNPVTEYGVAKAWQTQAARYYAERDVQVVVARLFNLLGEDMPEYLSIGSFCAQLKHLAITGQPKQLRVGNLAAKRDYVDILDACNALISIAQQGSPGEAYNVCSGHSELLKDLLMALIACSGIECGIQADPLKFRAKDVTDIVGTHSKLTNLSGWCPVTRTDQTIARIARRIRSSEL